jgi:hypothetical protein
MSCTNPTVTVKDIELVDSSKLKEPEPPPPPIDSSKAAYYKQFTLSTWLQKICSDNPDTSIKVFNFTIVELDSEQKYGLYLIGSKKFDTNDGDWAFSEDFRSSIALKLNDKELNNLDVDEVEKKIADKLKPFIKSHSLESCFLSKAEVIGVGFENANFIRLK